MPTVRFAAILMLLASPAWPQGGSASGRAVPRLPDGKPDFSGIWIGGGPLTDLAAGLPEGQKIFLRIGELGIMFDPKVKKRVFIHEGHSVLVLIPTLRLRILRKST